MQSRCTAAIPVAIAPLVPAIILAAAASFALWGCGHWAGNQVPAIQLPRPRMSPDSVVLEIASLRLPYDRAANDTIWESIDEQVLSNELRIKLTQNGFRCGIITGEIPTRLCEILAQPKSTRIGETDPESSHGFVVSQQRLQNRTGRRGKIVTSDLRDEIVSLMPNAGRVTGKTLFLAQSLLSIRSYPGGDGRVRLELVPEIEHGQPKTRYVGQPNEGVFRLDTGRERAVFNELRFEPQLAPGQSLLVTCTDDWIGLGRQFFAENTGDVKMQRVLLIRLAQTQIDDLFSSEATSEKEPSVDLEL